jgi:hypothetical protein
MLKNMFQYRNGLKWSNVSLMTWMIWGCIWLIQNDRHGCGDIPRSSGKTGVVRGRWSRKPSLMSHQILIQLPSKPWWNYSVVHGFWAQNTADIYDILILSTYIPSIFPSLWMIASQKRM